MRLGNLAGQTRGISSNTSITITVSTNWTTNPDSTSQYEVKAYPDSTSAYTVKAYPDNTSVYTVEAYPENGSQYELVERDAYRALFFEGSEDHNVATGGTTTTLVDSRSNWTTNFWGVVIIVDGAGHGQCRWVYSNTSTTITIDGTWTAPDVNSRYVLVETPKENYFGDPASYAVRELCTNEWNTYQIARQTNIDAVRSTLNSSLGFTASDYIEIPTFFNRFSTPNEAVALMPNMVNSLVDTSRIIIAKPFGPRDPNGNDVFEEKVKAEITGLTEYFIDDWDTYHLGDGEVHCGTNTTRDPPGTTWW